MDSLPISGVDGALKNRMIDIAGKVKAKTGLLAGVSSLSGYLESNDDLLAFSILTNGFIAKSLYAPECRTMVEDVICRLLVASA
jgi:D-alanyl-D-alanine carboxypeptidase/D-alanyl-D-alanine-endopeptidase (penicillin-binding protein 4)